MNKIRIAVVGGGASGLMAAIHAVNKNTSVTIFERNDRVGKKILSTGNGKCNLGNTRISTDDFYGTDSKFINQVLKEFPIQKVITTFEKMGLFLREKDGYLYPYSEQASAVLDVLRYQIKDLGVQVIANAQILEIKRKGSGFELHSETEIFQFDKVILSTGGKSAPKTGSDGNGYILASDMGHELIDTVPALVQLRCKEPYFKRIAGVRAKGRVTFEEYREEGEIQFTDYGISGIPVFQLSRNVAYALKQQREVQLYLDVLQEHCREYLNGFLGDRYETLKERTVEQFFAGILNKKLMSLFIKLCGIEEQDKVGKYSLKQLNMVLHLAKRFPITVIGTNSYEQAQVTAGGVDTSQVDARTMESKLVPGFYFAGELLDVDGKCGGYNLYFAWATGALAGMNAADYGNA